MIDYDPHDWRSHLFDIRGSMLREITVRVISCLVIAVIVTTFHIYIRPIAFPATVHALVGTALGLLLVFRTNSSYDRFWEGRKMWGSIINETRNIARQATTYLNDVPAIRDRAVRWTICWIYSAMHSLRGEKGLGPQGQFFSPDEVQRVLQTTHVPLAVAREISKQWVEARKAGAVSDIIVASMEHNVQLLVDYIGACERIHKTPLPFAYVVHLRRAILIYCYSLPFALLKEFGWWTILCTLLVAYIFTGIEEIGVEIEDPFGDDENDLPLESFCKLIERNLLSMIDAPSNVRDSQVAG